MKGASEKDPGGDPDPPTPTRTRRRRSRRRAPGPPSPGRFQGRPLSRPRSTAAASLGVLRAEVLRLLRDGRALAAAVLLPIVIYPVIFGGRAWIMGLAQEAGESREIHLAVDLTEAPEELAARLRELVLQEVPIDVRNVDASSVRELTIDLYEGREGSFEEEERAVREILGDRDDALLLCTHRPDFPDRPIFRVHFDGSREGGREADVRARRALERLLHEQSGLRRLELLGDADPARGLDLDPIDLASAEAKQGAALGRMLPIFAMLVIVSAGAYAALAAFAGERDAGRLELLLTQPVSPRSIAYGKLGAVWLAAALAAGGHLVSAMLAMRMGEGVLPGVATDGAGFVNQTHRLALGLLLFLPNAVLLCTVLAWLSASARSFREGQHLVLPLALVALTPAVFATQTPAPFDTTLAAVPLLGPCLALRDALRGELRVLPTLCMFVTHLLWIAWVIERVALRLSGEAFLSDRSPASASGRRRHARVAQRAVVLGVCGVLVLYLAGGLLANLGPLAQISLTQAVLLPGMAFLAHRALQRCAGPRDHDGGKPTTAAPARRPLEAKELLATLLLVPGLTLCAQGVVLLQESFLPVPPDLAEGASAFAWMADLGLPLLLLLFAVLPAFGEELFFRGVILRNLRRGMGPLRSLILVSLLFGAAHVSFYRILPTALVGLACGALYLRTRRVLPSMLLHAGHNALAISIGHASWGHLVGDPRLAMLSVLGLALLLHGVAKEHVRGPGGPPQLAAPRP